MLLELDHSKKQTDKQLSGNNPGFLIKAGPVSASFLKEHLSKPQAEEGAGTKLGNTKQGEKVCVATLGL